MQRFLAGKAIYTLISRLTLAGLLTSPCWVAASTPAAAGGMGRFLGALVAGGVVASRSQASAPKVYSPDVLTVAQLAACINKATKLDADSERLEADRAGLQRAMAEIDVSKSGIELERLNVDTRSQRSVNAFNSMIESHNVLVADGKAKQIGFNELVDSHNASAEAYNASCIKKYYADDLSSAQKLAAQL